LTGLQAGHKRVTGPSLQEPGPFIAGRLGHGVRFKTYEVEKSSVLPDLRTSYASVANLLLVISLNLH